MCNVGTSSIEYGLEKGLRLGEAKGRAEDTVLMSKTPGRDDSRITSLVVRPGICRAPELFPGCREVQI